MSAEGWGVLITSRRAARRQHYWLEGRTLCGRHRGPAPLRLELDPIGSSGAQLLLWLPCPKCRARSSGARFLRKREFRQRWRDREARP